MQSFKLKFLGVTILQGGRIFHFPIDFWMGLTTVQRDCAACDSETAECSFVYLMVYAAGRRLEFGISRAFINAGEWKGTGKPHFGLFAPYKMGKGYTKCLSAYLKLSRPISKLCCMRQIEDSTAFPGRSCRRIFSERPIECLRGQLYANFRTFWHAVKLGEEWAKCLSEFYEFGRGVARPFGRLGYSIGPMGWVTCVKRKKHSGKT